jgi:hypothetical protein
VIWRINWRIAVWALAFVTTPALAQQYIVRTPDPLQECTSSAALSQEIDCACYAREAQRAERADPAGYKQAYGNVALKAAAACPNAEGIRAYQTRVCNDGPRSYVPPGIDQQAYCSCWGSAYSSERVAFAPKLTDVTTSVMWLNAAKRRCDATVTKRDSKVAPVVSTPPVPAAAPAAAPAAESVPALQEKVESARGKLVRERREKMLAEPLTCSKGRAYCSSQCTVRMESAESAERQAVMQACMDECKAMCARKAN